MEKENMNGGSVYVTVDGHFKPVHVSMKGTGEEGFLECKYSINSLVYWVTYVHNIVYSFYRSMIYCYINSTKRCAGFYRS